jgi:precorrin-3B C17-methyltransferase
MTGALTVLGLGPGPEKWLTPEATDALAKAEDLFGYTTYLDRVPSVAGQTRHGSDNREEVSRAKTALDLAATGRRVAIVSGGDPGVFAMAAAVFEVIEHGPATWRAIDVTVLPGVTAMLAAAARVGAPLGADFCAINLSDNLKPWSVIESRLKLAAQAGFVMALYNPASKARQTKIFDAFAILSEALPSATPVVVARAIGRPDERVMITNLGDVDPSIVDMQTLLIVGTQDTRLVQRPNGDPWVYSPRRAGTAA